MATLTIRGIDDDVKAALRVRAAEHGRSMEAEVREILTTALRRPGPGMGTRIRQRFERTGADELELPIRSEKPRAADFPE